jgi:hypothetical protein
LVENKEREREREREMQYLGNHISVWIIWRNHTQNPLQENVINNCHLIHDKEKNVLNLAQILPLLQSIVFSIHIAQVVTTESIDWAELVTKLPAFYRKEYCVLWAGGSSIQPHPHSKYWNLLLQGKKILPSTSRSRK